MKKSRTVLQKIYLVLAGLSLLGTMLILVFIFYNGNQTITQSMQRSDVVVEKVKPVLDPQDKVDTKTFSHYVRKGAHLTEYSALGICAGLTVGFWWLAGGSLFFLLGATTLLPMTAIMDEYLQGFRGRGSEVKDIMIDLGGCGTGLLLAAIGIAVLAVATWLWRKWKQRKTTA